MICLSKEHKFPNFSECHSKLKFIDYFNENFPLSLGEYCFIDIINLLYTFKVCFYLFLFLFFIKTMFC